MQEGRFVLKSPFKPQGDQPQAIEALTQGVQSGMPCPGAAGRHRFGQNLHDGFRHRARTAPHAGHRPQQDAGRAAVRRVPRVFSGQRGGVFRLLL